MARCLSLVLLTLSLLLVAAPCSAQTTNLTATLLSLTSDSTYGTVATAIVAANLTGPIVSLANSGGVTLLAPTNQAFNALGNATVSLPSVLGPDVNITVSGSTVLVNGVTVVAPNVIQAIPSAVVHGISSVLIPPGGLQAVQAYCSAAPAKAPAAAAAAPTGASSGPLSGFNGLFALAMFAVCALQVLL